MDINLTITFDEDTRQMLAALLAAEPPARPYTNQSTDDETPIPFPTDDPRLAKLANQDADDKSYAGQTQQRISVNAKTGWVPDICKDYLNNPDKTLGRMGFGLYLKLREKLDEVDANRPPEGSVPSAASVVQQAIAQKAAEAQDVDEDANITAEDLVVFKNDLVAKMTDAGIDKDTANGLIISISEGYVPKGVKPLTRNIPADYRAAAKQEMLDAVNDLLDPPPGFTSEVNAPAADEES